MKRPSLRSLPASAWIFLGFAIGAAGMAGAWFHFRALSGSLQAQHAAAARDAVRPEPPAPPSPALPFDQAPTCAPLLTRLVSACQASGVDSLAYRARAGDAEPVETELVDALRGCGIEPGDAQGTLQIRRQEARLFCRTDYEGLQRLLQRISQCNPPIGVERIEVRSVEGRVEVELRVFGLCLES